MSTLTLVNLLQHRGRTLLTATGIAVGVATIVALLAVTSGLEQRAGELIHLGRADLGVFQRDAADPTTSVLPLDLVARLKRRSDIADATPMQLVSDSIHAAPAAIVFGADLQGFVARRALIESGRRPHRGEIMVGDLLAHQIHVAAGQRVTAAGRRMLVSGIYHSGVYFEDAGAITDLPTAQRMAGRRSDEATTIAVTLEPTAKASVVAAALRRIPGLQVIDEPGEAIRAGANGVLISKAVPLVVILALLIGALGVANTMLMSVLERKGELALLATIGWSPTQLRALILSEAVAVSVLGAALGLGLGVLAAEALVHGLGLTAFVIPDITAWGLGRGLIVGIAIGILGGLYPTVRVTRLAPAAVLART